MLKDYERLLEQQNKERLELIEKHRSYIVINLICVLISLLVGIYIIFFTEDIPYPALLLVPYFLFQAFLQNKLKNNIRKYIEYNL